MFIEKGFEVAFIASLSLREKQIQQNYRPIIAVHKWFARRPGTLFRGLILSVYSKKSFREAFYDSNHLKGIIIADPFMGGGTQGNVDIDMKWNPVLAQKNPCPAPPAHRPV